MHGAEPQRAAGGAGNADLPILRVLDSGADTPEFNMALDDLLLERAGPPTLRLYTWSPPGLSLGWFQPLEPFLAVPGPHRIVRRRTGGGAIYHGDELTFALTLDAALLPADVRASYDLLHGAVQRALASVGVATSLLPAGSGGLHARPRQLWCFAEPGAHDLVLADGRKIVGSAQRRTRAPQARVLHHGSIVLRTPEPTPFCGAVAELADPDVVRTPLQRALIAELAAALGCVAAATAPPSAEEIASARSRAAQFAEPARGSD